MDQKSDSARVLGPHACNQHAQTCLNSDALPMYTLAFRRGILPLSSSESSEDFCCPGLEIHSWVRSMSEELQ